MPRIINRCADEQLKPQRPRHEESALAQAKPFVPRSPPQGKEELAAKAISLLWSRLYASYCTFHSSDSAPFVVPRSECNSANTSAAQHTTTMSNPQRPVTTVSDVDWAAGFPHPSVDELIFHFYINNEPFDTFSWVIAFCLIDKLQLDYCVHQRIREITVLRQGDVAVGSGLREKYSAEPFRLFASHIFETLFTTYTLALKVHLDYSVTLNYLVNLLPHHRRERKSILSAAAALERSILQQLKYNCFVHRVQVVQLLDNFLTAEERSYLLHAVTS